MPRWSSQPMRLWRFEALRLGWTSTGLMSPLSRKSVEPMAAHVDPLKVRSRHQSLHHFVADANWSDEQMLLRVCQRVAPEMDFRDGGWWIIQTHVQVPATPRSSGGHTGIGAR